MKAKKEKRLRITLTLSLDLIKKIDNCIEYPLWRGNRSALIETILNEHFIKKSK